jgi:hypothetical protein
VLIMMMKKWMAAAAALTVSEVRWLMGQQLPTECETLK